MVFSKKRSFFGSDTAPPYKLVSGELRGDVSPLIINASTATIVIPLCSPSVVIVLLMGVVAMGSSNVDFFRLNRI
jgi:hypothetical protein